MYLVIQADVAGIVDPVFEIAARMKTSMCKHFNLAWAGLPAPVNQSQPLWPALDFKGYKMVISWWESHKEGWVQNWQSFFVCFYQTVF